jgi:hypothetical protein
MIDALGGALLGELVVFAQELSWTPKMRQVVKVEPCP